jgi:hypothetical protein
MKTEETHYNSGNGKKKGDFKSQLKRESLFMEIKKGIEYTMVGHEDVVEFAKGILAVTNAKSSRKDTILNVRTLDGSNVVVIHSLIEIDGFLEAHFKEIREKKTIDIAHLEYDDLNAPAQQWIEAQGESEEEGAQDYFVTLPTNFFWE